MVKKRKNILDCSQGDILAEGVYGKYGALVVSANASINDYIKQKLSNLGVSAVWIYECCKEKAGKDSDTVYSEFKRNYGNYIMIIKKVVCDLAKGKKINVENLRDLSDSIYEHITENSCIVRCLNTIASSDGYTYQHSINVALYSMLLGKWLGLSENEIKEIIKAGLLHDIGKTRIHMDILNKSGSLLQEEFEVIKLHTTYGYEIVKQLDELSEEVKLAVLMHHERNDNSGYPSGLKQEEIGRYAKIVAIADVYDAMTSERVYKSKSTPFEVFEMFQTTGLHSFDTEMVCTFLTNLSAYYTGAKVVLNTGVYGEVVYIPPHDITKPVVCIESGYEDLSKSKSLKILSIV